MKRAPSNSDKKPGLERLFVPNIGKTGRLLRALTALLLVAGGICARTVSGWLELMLLISGLFVAFEAARGWCALRACGVKTKY
jgi:hypothetical protein